MQLMAVKLAVEKVREMPLFPTEALNTVILGEYSGGKEGDTLSDHSVWGYSPWEGGHCSGTAFWRLCGLACNSGQFTPSGGLQVETQVQELSIQRVFIRWFNGFIGYFAGN